MSEVKKWHKLERGQALMEYWPTIPAAIMIIISAGLVGGFLRGSFGQTAEVLNRSSAGVDFEQCETTEEDDTGPTTLAVDTHLVELVSKSFDGTNTTVVYRVTSSEKKALSHWTLGIPKDVADNIIDQSEAWGWTDNDPTTGAVGIKFDTGYDGGGSDDGEEEGEGGKGKPTDGDEEEGAGGKGKGKDKRKNMSSRIMNIHLFQLQSTTSVGFADGESREIFLVLSGQYDWSATAVTTKSANNDGVTGMISAPTVIIDNGHTQTTIQEDCD